MKHENESDPSGNWGHLNHVDFTADTNHVSAEQAERYAYDQAELWAEVDENDNAAVIAAFQDQQAKRKWMQQGGTTFADMVDMKLESAYADQESWPDIEAELREQITVPLTLICDAIKSIHCANGKTEDGWLSDYIGAAAMCLQAIFDMIDAEYPTSKCWRHAEIDATSAQGRSDETDTQ